MATATQLQERIPVLSHDAIEYWESYEKAKAAKARADTTARAQDQKKKAAQLALTEEMGDQMRAALPDGRVIQRIKKAMHRKAQPARDVEWEELHEG